jgi:PHD/YefM family antitoxin component YafN of YafNO toxin-antitoxin module
MKTKTKERSHEVIFKDGKPKAVIIDIEEYHQMLERLEDIEDLKIIEKIRQRPLKFRTFKEFLTEYEPSV